MKSLLSKLHFGVLKFPFFYVSFTPGKSFILLFSLLISSVAVSAQTRLGLHFTQQELNIWRTRANVGPYKYLGYSSSNSSKDWERILGNANSFLSSPSSERWRGIITSGCIQPDSGPAPTHQGKKLRDAAFAYLITGNINYRNAVRNELLAQTSETYTDFSNRSRWCDGVLTDRNPSFEIASWVTRLLFAYDYIKSTLSDTDRQRLDKWFLNAATYFQRNIDIHVGKNFNNRSGEDYTLSAHAHWNYSSLNGITHYNGNKTSSLSKFYNNRRSAQVKFFTLVGIQQNNSSLKHSGKRFIKELLMFGTWPDGMISDYVRWTSSSPDLGWSYASHVIADAADIADHFARAGDMDLYRFTTSNGEFGTKGGTKNIALIINTLLNQMDGTIKRYGTSSSSNLNSGYLIDGVDGGWHSINDTWFAQSNIYYKNNKTRLLYTRTASNSKQYPYQPASSGAHKPFGGSWDSYPGVLFMFGEMENKVWPYINNSNPTSLTSEPTHSNTITVKAYGPGSPKFRVVVNGVIIGDATAGSSLQALKFTTKLSLSDIKTVLIHFYNDGYDRDLFVNSIMVGSQTISATSSSVKFDKYLLDGNDVVSGQAKLSVNGALVFKVSGTSTITNNTARQDFEETAIADAELPKINGVLISPNPNAGLFTLGLELNSAGETQEAVVEIIDVVGNSVFAKVYSVLTDRLEERIELPELPAGMYMMKVKIGEEVSVKRFIKQ